MITEYKFSDKDCRAVVRFRKTAWYLSVYDRSNQSYRIYKFPIEPKVRPLIEFSHGKEVGGLIGVLLCIPHEEIKS